MNRYLLLIAISIVFLGNFGCKDSKNKLIAKNNNDQEINFNNDSLKAKTKNEIENDSFNAFISKGYVILEKMYGDLNQDGMDDCIIIVKGSDKKKIFNHEIRGELDRNRRGIIILFNKRNHYDLAVKNYNCFSSEFEEGGNYYPPELYFEIKNGKLFVNYAHGRYGYWSYTFRFQNSEFYLIGYDANEDRGPVVNRIVSINYLTKKKIIKVNTNEDAESGEEVFKETISTIKRNTLIKLSTIKDFNELDTFNE